MKGWAYMSWLYLVSLALFDIYRYFLTRSTKHATFVILLFGLTMTGIAFIDALSRAGILVAVIVGGITAFGFFVVFPAFVYWVDFNRDPDAVRRRLKR